MLAGDPFIIYLHGFNSSPQSVKATQMRARMRELGLEDRLLCPALPVAGDEAMRRVEAEMARLGDRRYCFIGSSLGGFYATWLAEKHDARAILLNPSITPQDGLKAYLGRQQNIYTHDTYVLTEDHLRQWRQMWLPRITPSRYFLLVETGDAQLDYRIAAERYAGARQMVIEGGDHGLQSFPSHLPAILEFAGMPAPLNIRGRA